MSHAALAYLHALLGYISAFALGGAVGFERQWRQRNAGLRTNVLVALGAAAFADLGLDLDGSGGGTRIIAYIVSGIGFLGAGVILKDGPNIRGLNTAATLWCSAAIGALSGAHYFAQAASFATMVLAGNTLLRPLSTWIDRRPVQTNSTEAEFQIHLSCHPRDVARARDLMDDVLDRANYGLRSVRLLSDNSDQIELEGILTGTSAREDELNRVIETLREAPLVLGCTWSMSATG